MAQVDRALLGIMVIAAADRFATAHSLPLMDVTNGNQSGPAVPLKPRDSQAVRRLVPYAMSSSDGV